MGSATPVDDEASLIAQLRAGDESAYEQVVRTYGGRLLAVTRRIVGSDEDARDIVQDAFLNAFKSLDSFEGNSKLSTWLHRIAVNAALMKLRTRKRKPEQSIETLLPAFLDDGHHEERFKSWDEPVDKAMERAETRQLVRAKIDELPGGLPYRSRPSRHRRTRYRGNRQNAGPVRERHEDSAASRPAGAAHHAGAPFRDRCLRRGAS